MSGPASRVDGGDVRAATRCRLRWILRCATVVTDVSHVRWISAQRLAGRSVARIARALNDAGVACPSAVDTGRNRHRSGHQRMLTVVAAILANPRYTGRQVWNRQRTDRERCRA
ncbi:recombinase family protein [Micromonospora sp. Llam0]|uniref:recombinase family protein n=1 Tax=Micromonospora sp. Llam0 TaxID=2485143 RepID=UPI000F48505B